MLHSYISKGLQVTLSNLRMTSKLQRRLCCFDISVNTGQICMGFEADTRDFRLKVIDEQPKNSVARQ